MYVFYLLRRYKIVNVCIYHKYKIHTYDNDKNIFIVNTLIQLHYYV